MINPLEGTESFLFWPRFDLLSLRDRATPQLTAFFQFLKYKGSNDSELRTLFFANRGDSKFHRRLLFERKRVQPYDKDSGQEKPVRCCIPEMGKGLMPARPYSPPRYGGLPKSGKCPHVSARTGRCRPGESGRGRSHLPLPEDFCPVPDT